MDCNQVRRVLLLYLYKEKLCEEDVELVEGHLCQCPCCRREFDSLRETLQIINRFTLSVPLQEPEELRTRIYNRIQANGWFE